MAQRIGSEFKPQYHKKKKGKFIIHTNWNWLVWEIGYFLSNLDLLEDQISISFSLITWNFSMTNSILFLAYPVQQFSTK
jgi:hypothetical protein